MTTKLARAKVDRVTQVKNELAFRKGDIIEVLNKTPGTSGMWQGRVYSNAGSTKKVCKDSDKGALFPSSYVVPLSSDETNRIVGTNGGKTTTTSSTSSVTHGSFLSKSAHKPSTPTNHSTARPLTLSPSSSSSSATTPTKSSSNPFHKRSITSLVGSSDSNSSGSNVSNSSPSRVSHVRSLSSSRATMSVVTTSTSSLSSSSTSSTLKPARATLSSVEIKKRGTIIIDTESPFCIDNELKWKEIVPITVEITVGETKAKFSGLKKFTVNTYTLIT